MVVSQSLWFTPRSLILARESYSIYKIAERRDQDIKILGFLRLLFWFPCVLRYVESNKVFHFGEKSMLVSWRVGEPKQIFWHLPGLKVSSPPLRSFSVLHDLPECRRTLGWSPLCANALHYGNDSILRLCTAASLFNWTRENWGW